MKTRNLTAVPFHLAPQLPVTAAPGTQLSGRRGAGGNRQWSKLVPGEQPRSREEKEIKKTDFPPSSQEKERDQQWLTSCLHLPLTLWQLAQRDASLGLGYCFSSSFKPSGPPEGWRDVRGAEFGPVFSSGKYCCASPQMSSQCSWRLCHHQQLWDFAPHGCVMRASLVMEPPSRTWRRK